VLATEVRDSGDGLAVAAFAPDGKIAATGGHGGLIQLWDVAGTSVLGPPLPGPAATVQDLAFGAGTLYAGDEAGSITSAVIDPARAVDRVCERAGGGLAEAEWRRHVPGVPFLQVCAP
jgi:hypothetical protein